MTVAVRYAAATPAFVEVTAVGDVADDATAGVWQDVIAVCTEQGCWRVLLDARGVTRGPDQGQLQRLGERAEQLPQALRMAVIEPVDTTGRSMASFWETTAAGRGLAVRRFDTWDDAVAWLAR